MCTACDSMCSVCTGPLATECTECADGAYKMADATTCAACDSTCLTCSGGTVSDCTACPPHNTLTNGACITEDSSFYDWLD